jgi:hypothetical protein
LAFDELGPCQSDAEHATTAYPRARSCKAWGFRKLDEKNEALTEPALEASHASGLQIDADQETECMKTDALSQLKELGNKFLGLFGMSTDNFQMQQNPDGGYNIQFKK